MAGKPQGLGHEGHDIGLGDGLMFTDRQGIVVVGFPPEGFLDEEVTGHPAHGLQDPRVGNAPGNELFFDHPFPGFLKVLCRLHSPPAAFKLFYF